MAPADRVLGRAEARAVDTWATEVLGLSTACLMENAGRGLARVTIAETRRYGMEGVLVVAARGNNGGDGLVAARHLLLRGIPTRVLLASPLASFLPDSDPGRNLRSATALGIPILEVPDGESLRRHAAAPGRREIVVDAVLGTGLAGPVRGHLAAVLDWMGSCGSPVVAADIPSGLDADTGECLGPVPRCVATATFHARKRGLAAGRGPEFAGRVVVCDIGVPAEGEGQVLPRA